MVNTYIELNIRVKTDPLWLPSSQNEPASSWFQTTNFSPATIILVNN